MNTILESRHGTPPGISRRPLRQTSRQNWMVSFADLMAILLAFMVVSFSTKEINDVPWQHMNQSMLEAFKAVATSQASTSAIGSTGGVGRGASDEIIAELITDRFPQLASTGGVRLTSTGVEIDLARNPAESEIIGTVTRYLASLDREILVKVEASLPGQNPSSVQRTLAWESGLAAALVLRSGLLEQGLRSQPDIQVTMATGSGRSTLVVKSSRRAGR